MFNVKVLLKAYAKQRRNAKRRGVGFLLTFDEWLLIWVKSGKLAQRGHGKDKYCMTRPGDKGPYAVGNVVIKTLAENTLEAQPVGRKLPTETKQKMSKSKTGVKRKPFSEIHRKRLSVAHTGKVLSEEHKLKIGASGTGEKNAFYGKHHSAITKEKLREAALRQWAAKKEAQ